MEFINSIYLTSVQSILVSLACLYIVGTGRPEWALGIYLSTAGWTRSIMFGPIAHTWVFLATMIGASIVYVLRRPRLTLLPSWDRWIIPWMGVWWAWVLLLIGLFDPAEKMPLLRFLLLYDIAPLPVVLLFATDVRRARGLAIAYVLTTMVGGWVAISLLEVPIEYLAVDPTLTGLGIVRLGIVNYHLLAFIFSDSIILVAALFQVIRRNVVRLVLLASAGYCAYFLLLAGSRQAIGSVVAVLAVFVSWALIRRGTPRVRMVLLVGVIVLIGVALYQMAPQLIVRPRESGLLQAFDLEANRGEKWAASWRDFVSSPLWGTGFVDSATHGHNIFLSALADQGLVGMAFFVGLLVFVARQVRGIWTEKGTGDRAIWRMAFLCVVLLGLIHGLASGNPVSVGEIYWPVAFLWWLGGSVEKSLPVRQAVEYASQV
jgi:O-antigen ligase